MEESPIVKRDLKPPVFAAEEGWTELTALDIQGLLPAFVSGDLEGERLRVRYFLRDSDGALVGKAWFGPGTEGPPGHAHGGSIAALLDEAMGLSGWVAGHMVVAATVTINFREMLPLGTETTFEAWVEEVAGRKVIAKSRLFGPNDVTYGDASGLFLMLPAEKFARR